MYWIRRYHPSILIATPGQLLDHMENTRLTNGQKFGSEVMCEMPILILDETYRLLDMGYFGRALQWWWSICQSKRRETDDLVLCDLFQWNWRISWAENIKSDFVQVHCIQDWLTLRGRMYGADPGQNTNALVDQMYAVLHVCLILKVKCYSFSTYNWLRMQSQEI